jgi:hypothetical protein
MTDGTSQTDLHVTFATSPSFVRRTRSRPSCSIPCSTKFVQSIRMGSLSPENVPVTEIRQKDTLLSFWDISSTMTNSQRDVPVAHKHQIHVLIIGIHF